VENQLIIGILRRLAGKVNSRAAAGTCRKIKKRHGRLTIAVGRNLNDRGLAALKFGVDAAGIGGRVKTAGRNLFDAPLMPDELEGFDMAILDPPRSGAAAQCQMLAQSGIATIAMVSCNPASFARDAAILTESGFQLEWVQVIDQFSFSNHLEMIGAFRR
jgi:tRNA/tmRNA/rRNA uracil-C5-methylase (TrmA/RlmC/RlmD family)